MHELARLYIANALTSLVLSTADSTNINAGAANFGHQAKKVATAFQTKELSFAIFRPTEVSALRHDLLGNGHAPQSFVDAVRRTIDERLGNDFAVSRYSLDQVKRRAE